MYGISMTEAGSILRRLMNVPVWVHACPAESPSTAEPEQVREDQGRNG